MAQAEHLFLPDGPRRRGRRYATYHLPAKDRPRALIVHVHAFAEEMNKSRRMVAMQSRYLAERGFAVLQFDLFGCGDSSGEFHEASWADWVQDVVFAAHWLRERHAAPMWLWGHRAGCLLALEATRLLDATPRLLFWQPPASGRQMLQQFLRLRLAGSALDASALGAQDDGRVLLASGQCVEVGGYVLPPALASGLEAATLGPPVRPTTAAWLEISPREDATLLPGTRKAVDAWAAAGWRVDATVVRGPAFWQTQEIEDAPALLPATLSCIQASEATT